MIRPASEVRAAANVFLASQSDATYARKLAKIGKKIEKVKKRGQLRVKWLDPVNVRVLQDLGYSVVVFRGDWVITW